MNPKAIVALLFLIFTLNSCKKDENPAPASIDIHKFSQLEIGNYWIYGCQYIDRMSNVNLGWFGTGRDTITITSDTVINGNIFYVLSGTHHGGQIETVEYWRDSANCIVNETGHIVFITGRYDRIFQQEIVPRYYKADYSVQGELSMVGTGAGNFYCYIMDVDYDYVLYGKHQWHYKFTMDVGLVKWKEDDPAEMYIIEERLVDFSVQP